MTRFRKILPFLIGFAAFLILHALENHFSRRVIFKVEAVVSGAGQMELYANTRSWDMVGALPVQGGKLTPYVWSDLPASVHGFRLDPINQSNAEIEIRSIEIIPSGEGATVVSLTAAQMQSQCKVLNAKAQPEPGPALLRLRSTTADPVIVCDIAFPHAIAATVFATVKWTLFVGLILVFLGVGLKQRQFLWVTAPFAAQIFVDLCRNANKTFYQHWSRALPVSTAVGNTNYTGFPKQTDYRAFLLNLAGCLGLAFLVGWWKGRKAPDSREASPAPSATRKDVLFLVLVSLLFALYQFPDIAGSFASLASRSISLDFDSANHTAWQFFLFKGLVPLRDYWFPYGGAYRVYGPFPQTLFLHFCYTTAVFCVLAVSLGRLLYHRRGWIAFSLLFFWMLFENGHLTSFRYFIAPAVFLFFVAFKTYRMDRRFGIFCATAAVLCAWLFEFEPNQLAYVGLPMVAVVCADLWRARSFAERRRIVAAAVVMGACIALALAVPVLEVVLQGRWRGFVDFYGHLSDSLPGAAIAVSYQSWLYYAPSLGHYLAQFLFLAGGCGAFLIGARDRKSDPRHADAMLGLALMASLLYLKQLTRPDMYYQIMAMPMLALTLFLFGWSRRWSALQRKGAVAFAGILFASACCAPYAWNPWNLVTANLSRLTAPFRILALPGAELRAQEAGYFARGKYALDAERAQVIDELTRGPGDFYVFGDDSSFYVAAARKPFYFITLYDGDSFASQKRTVAELDARKPELAVMSPGFKFFDEVPNLVRVPLLYAYMARNYVPARTFKNYVLLKRRTGPDKPDLDFWRAQCGTMALGAIPSLSTALDLPACLSPSNQCTQVVHVHLDKIDPGKSVVIRATGPAGEFAFSLVESPGKRDYAVIWDRLWFAWSIPDPRLSFEGTVRGRIEMTRKVGADRMLY